MKQFVPSGYCLKCLGCCRFSENPTIWASPGCRLVESKGGYCCEHLNEKDNRCAVYSKRPLDCRLYPFLLVKRNGVLSLGLHKSCLFIEEKRPDIKEYADYLKKALNRPRAVAEIGKNPGICADYQENVEIVAEIASPPAAARNDKGVLKLNRLTIKDKPLVDKYLKKIKISLSAYHFAPLFIWKDLFKIYWVVIENNLCLFYQDNIGIFMPLEPIGICHSRESGNPDDLDSPVKPGNDKILSFTERLHNDALINKCFEIMDFYNPNKEISRIENVSQEITGRTKLKDIEYLCLRQALAELKGDAYRHKRASCNYFVRNYPNQIMPYRQSMLKDCRELYQLWMGQRKEGNQDEIYRQMLEDSGGSFNTALRYFKEIDLSGYVVKVDGKIKACSLGYPLNKETFCILFEVCDLRLKGIAQFIFREFCCRLSGYKYINIMGSSDLENLKRVKLSFHPIKEIKIYNMY